MSVPVTHKPALGVWSEADVAIHNSLLLGVIRCFHEFNVAYIIIYCSTFCFFRFFRQVFLHA